MSYRVLVAGGRGFIGRHLVRALLKRRHRVTTVDYRNAAENLTTEEADVPFISADLRDQSLAEVAMADVDICVLLSARCSGIGFFNTHPGEMLDDNLRILSATFNAARKRGLGRIVYVSSSCVFDASSSPAPRESLLSCIPPPPTGYPFSKLVGEYYCSAYQKQFGIRYTIVRPFNVYGPGEFPGSVPGDSHVIPDLTKKTLSGQIPLEILGDGHQTRSFTHVRDIAQGIVLALESPRAENEDFNLGHPQEVNILELAQRLWRICGREEAFSHISLLPFEHDIRRRGVDPGKAQDLLSWRPEIELDAGLAEYVTWFRNAIGVQQSSLLR